MNIQWYPGHMTKTRRELEKCLPLIDICVEIVDARIPKSSRNPDIDELIKNKRRIIVLNRCDLAAPKVNMLWHKHFKEAGINTIETDCKSGYGIDSFLPAIKAVFSDRLEILKEKGQAGRTIKIMVFGIPNVGKSTFINKIAGGNLAKAENRPGVTRGQQWIRLKGMIGSFGIDLMDTPGMLWPKIVGPQTGLNLAFTGAVRDEILDIEELAYRLIMYINELDSNLIKGRYNVPVEPEDTDILEKIGKSRNLVVNGGRVDTLRTANMVVDEFRAGKMGRITLERPK